MKKKVLFMAVMVVGAICFVSCGQRQQGEYEKQIVGKWHGAFSQEDEDGIKMVMETTTDYRSDKTEVFDGLLRFRVEVNDGDYANNLTFEYSVSGEGTWDVDGDYFIEKINKCDIELKKAYALAEMEDNDLYIGVIKEALEDGIPEIRNSMMQKSKDKIIKLNDSEFSIKDDEGDTETYTRIE